MNKWLILFFCCLIISCKGKTALNDPELLLQKQLDSGRMQQKVNKVIDELKADCDSTILELANTKVDSIRQAHKKIKKRMNR